MNPKNFKYLESLLQNASIISLTSDIVLDGDECEEFKSGIELARNGITIEGNGHTIDARNAARIFEVKSKDVTIKNLIFKNGSGVIGGAILNSGEGELSIVGCKFTQNSAERIAGCIMNSGYAYIEGTTFSKSITGSGGCISNQKSGILDITGCTFNQNASKSNGGCIENRGDACIQDSKFKSNETQGDGGCIANQIGAVMDLDGCEFQNNSAERNGGTILNSGNLTLIGCEFKNNSAGQNGGCILNQRDGEIRSSESDFILNHATMSGGAVMNWGTVSFSKSEFRKNSSIRSDGGSINNQGEGRLNLVLCEFKKNISRFGGGAVMNWGRADVEESEFHANKTEEVSGGAIANMLESDLTCRKSIFTVNESRKVGACIFNESSECRITECTFKDHSNIKNLVYNRGEASAADCIFRDNKNIGYHIYNGPEAKMDLLAGKITSNTSKKSAVHNLGELTVSKTLFKANRSRMKHCADILNESIMTLDGPRFESQVKCILNSGCIYIERLSNAKAIENLTGGHIEYIGKYDESRANFTRLNRMINESESGKVVLDEDMKLDGYELKFFECGIELCRDNLEIDGGGHTIDGGARTRIFLITARNVTLKNITFKNGHSANRFEEHANGGGALKITKGASVNLEGCTFKKNTSADDGGAILNSGTVRSHNSTFGSNHAGYYGGAVMNRGLMHSRKDSFDDNSSWIAGALYSKSRLIIEDDITLGENPSEFSRPSYNAGCVKMKMPDEGLEDSIRNTGEINRAIEWQPLTDLNELEHDISLEKSMKAKESCKTVIITDDITIDGAGHTIDMGGHDISFRIDSNVVLKNITIKNIRLEGNFAEIIKSATLENVRFLSNTLTGESCLIKNRNRLKITESLFADNNARHGTLIANEGHLEMSSSKFINNSSKSGAGIMRNIAEASISDSLFMCNISRKEAGCIRSEASSSLDISDTEFISNVSHTDGGSIAGAGKLNIDGCRFMKNQAKGIAGAILNLKGGRANLENCILKGNSSGKAGGAITNFGSLDLNGCEVLGNETKRNGGGINSQDGGSVNAKGCSFEGNSAEGNGGAIWTYSTADDLLSLMDCKLKDNLPDDIC